MVEDEKRSKETGTQMAEISGNRETGSSRDSESIELEACSSDA